MLRPSRWCHMVSYVRVWGHQFPLLAHQRCCSTLINMLLKPLSIRVYPDARAILIVEQLVQPMCVRLWRVKSYAQMHVGDDMG
jgi:hypothetical protein